MEWEYKSERPCPLFDDGRYCIVSRPIRESQIFCEECGECNIWTAMHRYYGSINFGRVWQEHWNASIGQHISDPKHFKDALKENEDFMSERLGYDQTFGEADPTDTDALGVTDEGMDATHNRQVIAGIKESKGRFVWPMT